VTISGGSILAVAGPVKIVLTGQLDASGGSFLNPSHVPANLQLESSYAGASGILLSGGTAAYLTVYAPRTSIGFSGSSPLYGALLGKTVSASGTAAIHYDVRALGVWASYFDA